jgi:hypothetical protein
MQLVQQERYAFCLNSNHLLWREEIVGGPNISTSPQCFDFIDQVAIANTIFGAH